MGEAGPYHWIVQLRRSSTAGMALLHQQRDVKQKKMHAAKEKGKEKIKAKAKARNQRRPGRKKIRASKEDRVLANLQHFDLEEEASSEGGLLILKRRPPQEEAS